MCWSLRFIGFMCLGVKKEVDEKIAFQWLLIFLDNKKLERSEEAKISIRRE